VRFEKTGEHPDPVTGKPVTGTTVYDYDATARGGEHYASRSAARTRAGPHDRIRPGP
jgi:hypothetical protein